MNHAQKGVRPSGWKGGVVFVCFIEALASLLLATSIASGQVTQRMTTGIVFVQFSDAATNPDARGSLGYDGNGNIVPDQYRFQDYWDVFYKSSGSVRNPDSARFAGTDSWNGYYQLGFYGSIQQWLHDNSGGRHVMDPCIHPGGYTGIVNSVTVSDSLPNARIEWITINISKLSFQATSGDGPCSNSGDFIWNQILQADTLNIVDTLDIVFVIYAGGSVCPLANCNRSSGNLLYCLIPEKGKHSDPKKCPFLYDQVGFIHEYLHSIQNIYGLCSRDLVNNQAPPYTPFNGQYISRQQSPMHLDPWSKLLLGWADPVILTERVSTDIELRATGSAVRDSIPNVAIIPLSVPVNWIPTTGSPNWTAGRYLMIENRRNTGFDHFITAADSCFQVNPSSDGGFLLWMFDSTLHSCNSSQSGRYLIEAGGRYYSLVYHPDSLLAFGSNSKFFKGKSCITAWSSPSTSQIEAQSIVNMTPISKRNSRNVSIYFPEYEATTNNINTIPRIEFDATTTNTVDALGNNNQRKLAVHGQNACLVTVSRHPSGVAAQDAGILIAYTSTDQGESWDDMTLVNPIYYRITGVGVHSHPMEPSVVGFTNSQAVTQFHLVWTDSTADGFQIRSTNLSSDSDRVVTPQAFIPVFGGTPTPVIAYGNQELRIVYQGTDGLYEATSTDEGDTWSTPAKIQGTTSTSSHPSLAKNNSHEVLVYQDVDSLNHSQIWMNTNGSLHALPKFEDAGVIDCFLPSVDLAGNVVGVGYVARCNEHDPIGGDVIHEKTGVQIFRLDSLTFTNVTYLFNKKFGRPEASEDPGLALGGSPGGFHAGLIWSVRDGQQRGARLRHNECFFSDLASPIRWQEHDVESSLSSCITRNPHIASLGLDARYVVVRDSAYPKTIESRLFSREIPVFYFPAEEGTKFRISDGPLGAIWARLISGRPEVMDNGTLVTRLRNEGLPIGGFDGSRSGPSLSALTKTEQYLMSDQQWISWTMWYVRDSSTVPSDTAIIRGTMHDNTGTGIGYSNTVKIAPTVIDTTFTLGFELPSSHSPEAEIWISYDATGGLFDQDNGYKSVLVNHLSGNSSPKSPSLGEESIPRSAVLDVYPHPTSGTLTMGFEIFAEAEGSIAIYDILGTCVQEFPARTWTAGRHTYSIDVSRYRSGLYFARVSMGSRNTICRFTVIR